MYGALSTLISLPSGFGNLEPLNISINLFYKCIFNIRRIDKKRRINTRKRIFFIYDRGKTRGFSIFYNIWPKDYFYLYLIYPFVIIFFIIQGLIFKKYYLLY